MDTTVIIRGNLHSSSLENVEKYLENFNVIISYWEDSNKNTHLRSRVWDSSVNDWKEKHYEIINSAQDKQKLNELNSKNNVSIIENKYKNIRIDCNFKFQEADKNIYQVFSSLAGLRECKTENVIVIRSDIPYPNLLPLKEVMDKNPEKIITSNTNALPYIYKRYQLGSHIIAGKTISVLNGYDMFFKLYKNENNKYSNEVNKIYSLWGSQGGVGRITGEQMLACSMLLGNGIDFTKKNDKEILKRHFEIIEISKLGGKYRPNENIAPHLLSINDISIKHFKL